jgi:hypothetical protein
VRIEYEARRGKLGCSRCAASTTDPSWKVIGAMVSRSAGTFSRALIRILTRNASSTAGATRAPTQSLDLPAV